MNLNSVEINTWISFLATIIGSLIGGGFAFCIMKYQVKKQYEQIEKDRQIKLKLDLQVDTYKEISLLLSLINANVISHNIKINEIYSLLDYNIFYKQDIEISLNKYAKKLLELEQFDYKLQNIIHCKTVIIGNLANDVFDIKKNLNKLNVNSKKLFYCMYDIIDFIRLHEKNISNNDIEIIKKIDEDLAEIMLCFNEEVRENLNDTVYLIDKCGLDIQKFLAPIFDKKICNLDESNYNYQKLRVKNFMVNKKTML